MRQFLLFILFALLPLTAIAQCRYTNTWQDFLNDNWKTEEGRVGLVPSAKEDCLALDVEADKKKTAKMLRKTACVIEWGGSLYLNLRPFNTFGDVFVQAWRIGGDKVLFARQDVAPSRFSIANGDSGIPLSRSSFRSLSKLENLVCYLAAWDPQREELRIARVTAAIVAKFLAGHPAQLSQYQQLERGQREQADIVITTLQAAGVI